MSDDFPEFDSDLTVVASLAEPVRRTLYEYVRSAGEPVGRDQAARATRVSRQVAAYHLDRLADAGLLDVEYRRLTGREGPGAGRPAKLYRKTDREYEVSVPPRRYELAARILLEAATEGQLQGGRLDSIARRTGERIGVNEADLPAALEALGYQPAVENDEIRFRNCPFHVLQEQDRQTTCGMNLALVEGLIDGSGSSAAAVLAPEDGYCCVRLRPGSVLSTSKT